MPRIEKENDVVTENLAEHPAVLAWRRLPGKPEFPSEIVVLKTPRHVGDHRLSCVYLLGGVGDKGTNVIAKLSAPVERVVYEQLLPQLPVPKLSYYGSVPDTQRNRTWIFQEHVAGARPYSVGMGWRNASSCQHTVDCHSGLAATWLGRFHASASDRPNGVRLPDRSANHYLHVVQETRSRVLACLSSPYLASADLTTLMYVAWQCDAVESLWDDIERFCRKIPQTVVHGDFVSKNLRVRESAGIYDIFVFDWEMAGWGLPACDLHWLSRSTGLQPHIKTYLAAVRRKWSNFDEDQIGTLCYIGRLFRLLDSMNWAAFPHADKFAEGRKRIGQIEWYKTATTQCISDLRERLRRKDISCS